MQFLTRFWQRLLYVIALGEGFRTSTQNFDLGLIWPLTLILYRYCKLATKYYFFAISNPISIPSALCDSTRWGLQKFYTEFWPLNFDLDFILYTLLQNATPLRFLTQFRLCSLYVKALGKGFKISTQNFDLWLFDLVFLSTLYIGYKRLLLHHF